MGTLLASQTAPEGQVLGARGPVVSLDAEGNPSYCPTRLLASFALLMAGHGRCVNTDMMLGDRDYAQWQLACARETEDPELTEVAEHLAEYFADAALPVLGTA